METIGIYTGVVKGRLVDKESLNNALKYFEGKEVDVIIKLHSSRRSNQQNKYYWAVIVKLISDHTGFTSDEVHEILLDKFAEKKELKIGDEIHFVADRSHKMKTDAFERYTEQIRIWAASELGVVIPLPNEIITDDQL